VDASSPRRFLAGRRVHVLYFFLAFTVLTIAIHLPYLRLPFFWDELGQFVPAALDLFHDGAWIPHSTAPNVHPPGLMALLALVWHVIGFSIVTTRVTMLLLASWGVLLSFLLAIRLARGTAGAPAFAAVLFLIATPIFFTQSMMAQLDLPAMVFTALALLLFFERRLAASAIACTAAVLMKETAITTPLVFALWLWLRERQRREALYFLAPAVALGLWMLVLRRTTGHWFGDPGFTQYNLTSALEPVHILLSIARRIYFLFIADGRWIGAIALFAGWRVLRGKQWTLVLWVALAQVAVVTVLGGAVLDRYLLPVLPILYAAMASAASVYPPSWRWAAHAAMIGALFVGWFWDPPYLFPYEDNLSMVDFVRLQQQAAEFLGAYAHDHQIGTAWPLTEELTRPELGYVELPFTVAEAHGFELSQLADLDRNKVDLLVVYSRDRPFDRWPFASTVRQILRRYFDYHPEATSEEIRAGLGFAPVVRFTRGSQWLEVYQRQ
jgi:4-amino-4-deoxy-L-arabinose transferase-like glycosyltransferase